MNGKKAAIVGNFLLWQAGWFAAIIGAGRGYPIEGSIAVALLVSLALSLRGALRKEISFVVAATLCGYAIDSTLVLAGWIEFPDKASLGQPSTLWMSLLWANLAAQIGPGGAFGWIDGKMRLAAIIGATSGPLAYYGGAKLGAITFTDPKITGLIALAVLWGVAFPALYWLRGCFTDRGSNRAVTAPLTEESAE